MKRQIISPLTIFIASIFIVFICSAIKVSKAQNYTWSYVAMGNGLKHSTNSGTSFTSLNNVSACSSVGIGKAAPGSPYYSIYVWGTVNGITGIFRSIDEGASWSRINDNAHQYGGPGNGQFVIGDMNIYGRVYMSTVGRGIAYGNTQVVTAINTVISSNSQWQLTVLPNPVINDLRLKLFVPQAQHLSIKLTSISGMTMFFTRKEMFSGDNTFLLNNISTYTSGIYFVEVFNKEGKKVAATQIIKQ